jgi:predicted exporter
MAGNPVPVARYLSGLWLLAMLLLGVWQLPTLTLDSNLLALFPDADSRSAEARIEQALSARFERRVVLLLGAKSAQQARQAMPSVRAKLLACDCFQPSASDAGGAALGPVYRNHVAALLTPPWRERLEQLSPAQLVDDTVRQLTARPGGISAQTLLHDPLGSLAAFKRAAAPTANIRLDPSGNAYVLREQRRYYVVPLELTGSPFDVKLQRQAHRALAGAEAYWQTLPGAEVLKAGALFYTMAGTEQARQEISTVGVGSLLGILVLLLLVFRSAGLLLLAFAPLLAGVLGGLAVSAWVFGAVHVMALVFGAALVGVAIDYSLHYFTARSHAGPSWHAPGGTRELLPPLLLGLATSVVGYLSFMAAGFPGFTQIAVLSSSGLITALATVLLCYPALLARPPKRAMSGYLRRGVERWSAWQQRLLQPLARPKWLWLTLLLSVALLSVVPTSDSIRQMQRPAPALVAMQTQVQESLGGGAALQYVLVQAPSSDLLLQRLALVSERLQPLSGTPVLAGHTALSQVLPTPSQQRANRALWQRAVIDSGALQQLAQRLSLTDEAYGQMRQVASPGATLTLAELAPAAAGRPDLPPYVQDNQRHYSAVSLRPPLQLDAVRQRLRGLEGATLVDPVARTDKLLRHYRHSAGVLLLCAYAAIALLLARRYGVLGAAMVVTPPALASAASLLALSALGLALNVFNFMALLLVLGVGIDYTLFLREARAERVATRLAIMLSSLTTVLSFGLLALSATAAIYSFGLTVLIGMVLAYLLAPLAVLAQPDKRP